MPYIKQREKNSIELFLSTRTGETFTAAILGGAFHLLISMLFIKICVFVSQTLYPFTYPFFHSPLHSWLPSAVLESNPIYKILFSALFALLIYYFEKNIFYRRFSLVFKTAFASLAGCVYFYIFGFLSAFLPIPEVYATDLLSLFIYHYLTLLPLFLFCDSIRRRLFLLP